MECYICGDESTEKLCENHNHRKFLVDNVKACRRGLAFWFSVKDASKRNLQLSCSRLITAINALAYHEGLEPSSYAGYNAAKVFLE